MSSGLPGRRPKPMATDTTMSLLLGVLNSAHCRSTHHHFALDSLRFVGTAAGSRLVRRLLREHERYLLGATAPDDRFRDFHNHCVHVDDDYWGGAPRLAMLWYRRLVDCLVGGQWADAAYAAGILSHYFTDPLQPLHTAQSPREPLVHRAIERSVRHSYQDLYRLWADDDMRAVFHLGDQPGWLAEAILKGARFSNRRYDAVVESYDLQRGSSEPQLGLSHDCRLTFATLIGLAITGLARIWERVAAEAECLRGAEIDRCGLRRTTLLAILQVPEQRVLRRLTDIRERNEVARVLEEYRRSGQLVQQMPAECYIKSQVWLIRQRENRWRQQFAGAWDDAGDKPAAAADRDRHSHDPAQRPDQRRAA